MDRDAVELIKVMLVAGLLMALGTFALLGLATLLERHGGGLPIPPDLVGPVPQGSVGLIAFGALRMLGGAFLVASGIALLTTSATLDAALMILAKALAVLITAELGMVLGAWGEARVLHGQGAGLPALNMTLAALLVALLFSTALRNQSLRSTGNWRFPIALVLIALGPVLALAR